MNGLLAPGWQKRILVALLWASLGIVAALLMGGCSPQNSDTPSDRTVADIQVYWMSAGDVNDTCRKFGLSGNGEFDGCARSKPGNSNICEVYVVEPRNFGDAAALKTLGHEFWHCLGATHPG